MNPICFFLTPNIFLSPMIVEIKMEVKFDSIVIFCVLVPTTVFLVDIQYMIEGMQVCASH